MTRSADHLHESDRPKVLFVSHNHPAVRPGGTESYALDLYEAIRDGGEFEPLLIARADHKSGVGLSHHEGTPITAVNRDPNQYFFHTRLPDWDWMNGRYRDKSYLTRHFRDFLLAYQPDVVHFQHTVFIGYDIVRVTRDTLPDVPIVYTLHEYMPICHRGGQMVRTYGNDLCRNESPRRCHECFPQYSMQDFFVRKRFIKSQLSQVDLFMTPSPYARERYIDWGIPAEKIKVFDHGFKPARPLPDEPGERPRNRFGFFGQFTPYKGADILLEAIGRLGDEFDGHVWIHGANLEMQPDEFRKKLERLIDASRSSISLVGSYDRSELAGLMAGIDWVVIPSIWWETGPLVVGEAFQHGRPILCSDIGGMSERVADGINGLYFRRADPDSLADAMRKAAGTPGLWERLRRGIPEVQSLREHADSITGMYRDLLASKGLERPRAFPVEPEPVDA